MGLIRIRRNNLHLYQRRLSGLEKLASYPIGDDRFQIDHGDDYLRFFDRLGEVYYYASLERGQLIAVGAVILRRVPFRQGGKPRRCWYGADVKVHPDHRGQRLLIAGANRKFIPHALRCLRGYAITMNPADGRPNRVVKIAQRFRWLPITISGILQLYSLDADQMRAVEPLVIDHRGPVSYLSLGGIKDIVLESTGQPMPLLHVQFGPCAERGQPTPEPGSTHMFCARKGDPLARAMEQRGFEPSATATIVSSGMADSDFRFVLTSDI